MTNQSKAVRREPFKAALATIIAFVLVFVVFTSTAFAESGASYDVTIEDGNNTVAVTTNETEPINILKAAGISLGDEDKLDTTAFESGVGGTIEIQRLNSINVKFDRNLKTYKVYSATVGAALKEIGATVKGIDKMNYSTVDPVKDGMLIEIKSAFSVSLTADSITAKYAITEGTVRDLLRLAGITLGSHDYTKPSVNTALKKNMRVRLFRVAYNKSAKTEEIDYKTVKEKDKTLEYGKTKVAVKGKKGIRKVFYNNKYINGKLVKRFKTGEKVAVQPTDKVVKVGTKSELPEGMKPNGVQSKNGLRLGQVIHGRATRYCCCVRCCGNTRGITASGRRVHNGMKDPHYIACNWLPMGTVVKVFGKVYTVVDRGGGGLSRVGAIDIYTPQGHNACYHMQAGSCTIKILRLGW